MNILLFILSLLSLLTIVTYGRLETFQDILISQIEFTKKMNKEERNYFNQQSEIAYKDNSATLKEKEKIEEFKRNPASPVLSFNLFVDKEERLKHPKEFEALSNLAHHLLLILYEDQPFFKEAEKNRPHVLNEIFQALIGASEHTKRPMKDKEIATIDLHDPELNRVFTFMLKGNHETIKKDPRPIKLEKGYYSLLDFITVSRNKLKIRIFLASKQLLMALYGNEQIVKEILNLRQRLYKQLDKDYITEEEASLEFKTHFSSLHLAFIPSEMLDFGVSKTNPTTYE